jgi:ABC-type bacteriocin/lantibiotic exporter with double-glycine peptidase domain
MAVSIVALLFSVGLGLILPLVIRNLVDLILVENDLPQLNRLAIGLFAVFIMQAIASFIHRLSLAYVGENAVADIRVQVYSHLQALSLRFFGDYRTGEIHALPMILRCSNLQLPLIWWRFFARD